MSCESYSASEALTRQFYEWEMRGRGWQVWSRPVGLEPPFRPFFGHFVPGSPGVVDDGRRPTGLSRFIDGLFKGGSTESPPGVPQDDVEPEPVYMDAPTRLIEVQ